MKLSELRKTNRVIAECLRGSQAYNVTTPDSDYDYTGIYMVPMSERVSKFKYEAQIDDKSDGGKGDDVFYGCPGSRGPRIF